MLIMADANENSCGGAQNLHSPWVCDVVQMLAAMKQHFYGGQWSKLCNVLNKLCHYRVRDPLQASISATIKHSAKPVNLMFIYSSLAIMSLHSQTRVESCRTEDGHFFLNLACISNKSNKINPVHNAYTYSGTSCPSLYWNL